jgi:hypothetical protein
LFRKRFVRPIVPVAAGPIRSIARHLRRINVAAPQISLANLLMGTVKPDRMVKAQRSDPVKRRGL